jgi:hypothetical protein
MCTALCRQLRSCLPQAGHDRRLPGGHHRRQGQHRHDRRVYGLPRLFAYLPACLPARLPALLLVLPSTIAALPVLATPCPACLPALPACPAELLYEELGLEGDEGQRYLCSLDGSRTSANQCNLRYGAGASAGTSGSGGGVCGGGEAGQDGGSARGGGRDSGGVSGSGGSVYGNGGEDGGRRHHHAHPTVGGPWEEARERQLGATGAQ